MWTGDFWVMGSRNCTTRDFIPAGGFGCRNLSTDFLKCNDCSFLNNLHEMRGVSIRRKLWDSSLPFLKPLFYELCFTHGRSQRSGPREQYLCSHGSGAGSLRSGCWHGPGLVQVLFLAWRKATNAIIKAPSLWPNLQIWPNHLPKNLPPNTVTMEVRALTNEL